MNKINLDGYIELVKEVDNKKVINIDNICYHCELVKSPFCCCYLYIGKDEIKIFNPITLKEIKTGNNNTSGYYRFRIPNGCGFTGLNQLYIHQLIAIWKYGDFFMYNKDYQIDHIDNNKANNTPNNIQILLAKDNAKKRITTERVELAFDKKLTPFHPEVFDNIFMSDDYKLYKPVKREVDLWYELKMKNPDKRIYVLTDKNKHVRNYTIRQDDLMPHTSWL